jgi:hypothetical protein
MVEAAQDMMADFMLRPPDSSTGDSISSQAESLSSQPSSLGTDH